MTQRHKQPLTQGYFLFFSKTQPKPELLRQLTQPGLQIIEESRRKALSVKPDGSIGAKRFQILRAAADAAGAGGAERHDGFAGEVVAFDTRADDTRRLSPPDGVRVILLHAFCKARKHRPCGRIFLLPRCAGIVVVIFALETAA